MPWLAPAATQGGQHVASNIRRGLASKPPLPFRYTDKGSLATIGRKAAVADFGRLRFSGFFAWLLWMGVHVLFLIGFRNKAAVMMEWAWAYLTYQRSACVILRECLRLNYSDRDRDRHGANSMHRRGLLTTAVMITALWGCTPNFWSLRTGVEGGAVEGSVEATLVWSNGCDDLTVFAMDEEDSTLLIFEMSGPILDMHEDRDRLRTHVLSADDDFTLTVHTGQNLYGKVCQNDYYGYYYDSTDAWEDTEVGSGGSQAPNERVFEYASGDVRMHLTAPRRRWRYSEAPVHVKLLLDDITLVEAETGAAVSVPGMMIQTNIYQPYWYH